MQDKSHLDKAIFKSYTHTHTPPPKWITTVLLFRAFWKALTQSFKYLLITYLPPTKKYKHEPDIAYSWP